MSSPASAELEKVYAAALRLSALTSDVIELAEGGGRLADREPTSFSSREVFESVADMVQLLADQKGLDVQFELDLPLAGQRPLPGGEITTVPSPVCTAVSASVR